MSFLDLHSGLWKSVLYVPLLRSNVALYIVQENPSDPTSRQQHILESMESLPASLLDDIADHALGHYRRSDAATEGILVDSTNVAKHFQYKSILIPEIQNCETKFFFLSADCDWGQEHGMQFLIGDGRVIACGDHSSLPFSKQWLEVISAPREKRENILKRILA